MAEQHLTVGRMPRRNSRTPALTGAVAGGAIAGIVLIVAAVLLLRLDGATPKVLVAVWLWALPVLGLGSLGGRLAGALAGRGGISRETPTSASTHPEPEGPHTAPTEREARE